MHSLFNKFNIISKSSEEAPGVTSMKQFVVYCLLFVVCWLLVVGCCLLFVVCYHTFCNVANATFVVSFQVWRQDHVSAGLTAVQRFLSLFSLQECDKQVLLSHFLCNSIAFIATPITVSHVSRSRLFFSVVLLRTL